MNSCSGPLILTSRVLIPFLGEHNNYNSELEIMMSSSSSPAAFKDKVLRVEEASEPNAVVR